MNTVLVVAAHPDDEVLGCGGSIASIAKDGCSVHVLLMADGESSRFETPENSTNRGLIVARKKSMEAACKTLGCATVDALGLPDNQLDKLSHLEVVKQIETFIDRYRPTTVFTHHASDVNIDHRVVHSAVVTACRPKPNHPVKELFFFEVPSSTEWQPPGSAVTFNPNLFIDITDTLAIKLKALQAYQSELLEFPHPRSLKAIEALVRWRGATAGIEAAEAFVIGRKIIS